jgi:hypothetical protein
VRDRDGVERIESPIVEIGLGQLAEIPLEELRKHRFVGLPGVRELRETSERYGHLRVDEPGFGGFRIVLHRCPSADRTVLRARVVGRNDRY